MTADGDSRMLTSRLFKVRYLLPLFVEMLWHHGRSAGDPAVPVLTTLSLDSCSIIMASLLARLQFPLLNRPQLCKLLSNH